MTKTEDYSQSVNKLKVISNQWLNDFINVRWSYDENLMI